MEKEVTKNRGSEWKKWDLHLHSFYTSINNNFNGSTKDQYIKQIKDGNLMVVGLTNYFNFSSDDWDLKNSLEEEGVCVFLNLEIRLTYTNKEDDCCDLHIIFSNEVEKKYIDAFLTKLNCSINGTQKMLNTITEEKDKKTATVEFNKVIEVLTDRAMEPLKDKVLIGMLSRGKGNSRSSTMYESLTKDADFIIHSSDKAGNIADDLYYWSGKDYTKKPFVCKALFQSSDAHNIDDIGTKCTWVKGVPCFETLRQAVVDYENRILIQDRNPSDGKNSSPSLFIDKIEYLLNGENNTLYFNKDINSVIGTRGSGKSVLLKHIAWDLKVAEAREINKLESFKVHWCDGVSDEKFVEYIPQNYLSAITYEDGEKYDERDQKLRELLFNNDLFKNADTNKAEAIDSIELKINAKVKEVLSIHRRVVDTTSQLKPLGKAEDKDNAIKTKQEEISKLGKTNITDDDIKNQAKYSSEIESLNGEIKLLEQDVQIIMSINNDKGASFFTVDDEAFVGLSQTTLELIEKHIEKLSSREIKAYLVSLLNDLTNRIDSKKDRKITIEKQLSPINENLQQNKTIEKILKEISRIDGEKKEIGKLNKFIQESNERKVGLITEIADLYSSFKERIEGIVQTLKDEFSNFTFITFDFTVGYDVGAYKSRFFDVYIDGRSGERFKKFIRDNIDFNNGELIKIIKDIIVDADTAKLKTIGDDKESALVALLSCRYDIDFTKSVKYKSGEGLVDFENMTGGQKAMALLDLIFTLSKSNFPIIIDQPENDIDVSGISNDLKELILKQKEQRQVIIATHSSNLLLLTDTENVIVANNETNNIAYKNGGIEDKNIQESIIKILEGGEDALRKRMSKLNFIK